MEFIAADKNVDNTFYFTDMAYASKKWLEPPFRAWCKAWRPIPKPIHHRLPTDMISLMPAEQIEQLRHNNEIESMLDIIHDYKVLVAKHKSIPEHAS